MMLDLLHMFFMLGHGRYLHAKAAAQQIKSAKDG
jgi:hypothetical protein